MNRNEIHLILLYEFKLDHKAAEASRNINFAFGAGTVSNVQHWNGFKNSVLEILALRKRKVEGDRLKLTASN